MIPFEDFLPETQIELPGCPELLIINALRDTARDFCRASRIWQEWLDADTVIANVPDMELELSDQFEKVAITRAEFNGYPIDVIPESIIDRVSNWKAATGTQVNAVIELAGKNYRVYPNLSENAPAALAFRVALMPSKIADEVGDIVFNEYAEVIGAGAKAKLQMMPNKEWSAPQHAAINNTEYKRGRQRARNKAYKQYSNGGGDFAPAKLVGAV